MKIVKPVIYTFLYILFIEIIGLWILIADYFNARFLVENHHFINGIIMVICLIIFTYLYNKKPVNLPQKTSYKWYILSVIIGISFVLVQIPLNWIYDYFSGENHFTIIDFDGFGKISNLNIISSLLFIPVTEELFFREFIQKNLQKQTNVYLAIGLTSILFASIHLPYVFWIMGFGNLNFHHAYITLFGGATLGIVYYKSKSIGPAILLHIFWNLFANLL